MLFIWNIFSQTDIRIHGTRLFNKHYQIMWYHMLSPKPHVISETWWIENFQFPRQNDEKTNFVFLTSLGQWEFIICTISHLPSLFSFILLKLLPQIAVFSSYLQKFVEKSKYALQIYGKKYCFIHVDPYWTY